MQPRSDKKLSPFFRNLGTIRGLRPFPTKADEAGEAESDRPNPEFPSKLSLSIVRSNDTRDTHSTNPSHPGLIPKHARKQERPPLFTADTWTD
jgi:hypothetical protein